MPLLKMTMYDLTSEKQF